MENVGQLLPYLGAAPQAKQEKGASEHSFEGEKGVITEMFGKTSAEVWPVLGEGVQR